MFGDEVLEEGEDLLGLLAALELHVPDLPPQAGYGFPVGIVDRAVDLVVIGLLVVVFSLVVLVGRARSAHGEGAGYGQGRGQDAGDEFLHRSITPLYLFLFYSSPKSSFNRSSICCFSSDSSLSVKGVLV